MVQWQFYSVSEFVEDQSDTPGALKEAEGGQVVGRFEEIGFGCSFVQDAEAVKLHISAG